MASVSGIFLGFGLEHRAQPVPVAVQHSRHTASGRQDIVRKSLRSQLLDGFLRGQAGERQGRAKSRVLLRMTFRQFPQGLRHLGVFLLPQFRTAAERVQPQTDDTRTFLMQTERKRSAPPPLEEQDHAGLLSGLRGNNSSMRLFGQEGSFSRVLVSQAMGSMSFMRAVSSRD
jgi:hypothetical protein